MAPPLLLDHLAVIAWNMVGFASRTLKAEAAVRTFDMENIYMAGQR
jgi:hypothetical protein